MKTRYACQANYNLFRMATAAAFRSLITIPYASSLAIAPKNNLVAWSYRTLPLSLHRQSFVSNPNRKSVVTVSSRINIVDPLTKRYTSRNTGDEDTKEESLLTTVTKKIKSFLPFLKDEKTKKAELSNRKAKEEISSEIDKMLSGAPLPVRLMGKMVSPILGSLAGSLAETVREQGQQLDSLMDEANLFINSDYQCQRELGSPIDIGKPFSQSSSTVTINGVTRKSIQAIFEVRGRNSSGLVTMQASERGIDNLVLNVNGRNFNIDTSGRDNGTRASRSEIPSARLGKNKYRGRDDLIIDAELVDKVKK